MRKFQDKDGTAWDIDLNFGAILRVKTLSDGRFNLLKPDQKITHEEFDEPISLQALLMLDYPSLWKVIYMIVEPQAQAKNVTAEKFAELMTAQCLVTAKEVFRDEWRDFFLALQRPDQALALEKIGKWMGEAGKQLEAALANPMLKELDKKVTEAMDSSLKRSFGKLEDSLASIPAASPGNNLT